MASWSVRSIPERAFRVRALAGELNAGGNPAMDEHSIHGGSRNRDKLRLVGHIGPYADLTFFTFLTR